MPESNPTQAQRTPGSAIESALTRFGLASFRPGQREAIDRLLDVGRVLLVAPTGGGKSLAYQLPASLLPGTSLIISPLVSLMQDQVQALDALAIPATFLAATLSADEMTARMQALAHGKFKLAYVAPERLAFPGFRALVRDLSCPLVAIDEAHCISEWGHDFRPDYMQLGSVIRDLPTARILACTATATPIVRDEILAGLGLPPDTPQVLRGFARPNLSLRAREVSTGRERAALVDATLEEAIGPPSSAQGCAIVYAPTRKATEREAERIRARGYATSAYHAGLGGEVRQRVHERFTTRSIDVVVATNAFGMGIDRADVRGVIHLAPPSSIEAYYQEVGRAGRDGADALGMLLISPGDMPLRRHLIESDSAGRLPDPEVVRHKWQLFLELMRWSEGGSCRHDAILSYFGDDAETLAGCGRCDVCRHLIECSDVDDKEASLIVRKALSGVARVHGRFGIQAAAKLLRGASDARVEAAGLHHTPTFGVLSDQSDVWITRLLRRLVTAGWVDFIGGERPVVVLTEEGVEVMRGDRSARLRLPAGSAAASSLGRPSAVTTQTTRLVELDDAGHALFEALRAHRLERARELEVPPYVIASDRTLRDIAAIRPRSEEELSRAHGIGPSKIRKFGPGFLAVIELHR